jgi:anti-sigma factor RsiW
MTCRELSDVLMRYLDGEASAAEQASFERHLAACDDCVAYVAAYRETVRLGQGAFEHPDEPVPDTVPATLVRAIRAARKRG